MPIAQLLKDWLYFYVLTYLSSFIYLLLKIVLYFFHYHLSLLCPSPIAHNHLTVAHVTSPFTFFAQSRHLFCYSSPNFINSVCTICNNVIMFYSGDNTVYIVFKTKGKEKVRIYSEVRAKLNNCSMSTLCTVLS